MSYFKLRDAARDLEREVDEEATKLVLAGVPMWDAIAEAQELVRKRRMRAVK